MESTAKSTGFKVVCRQTGAFPPYVSAHVKWRITKQLTQNITAG